MIWKYAHQMCACQRLHCSVTFYWEMFISTGVLCDPIWSIDRHTSRALHYSYHKIKMTYKGLSLQRTHIESCRAMLGMIMIWIHKSSQRWWTSFGGGQPHLEVEGWEFISCAAWVWLPALCSLTLSISSHHVMYELWRHSGYVDQLSRKRAF
jgi:hypothetical protein